MENTPLQPRPDIRDSNTTAIDVSLPTDRDNAPEKKLTLFAMRVAVLEKLATMVGTLAFIWATVVLLGGFATALKAIDFWMVTGILLVEGFRISTRRKEIDWQHEISLEQIDLAQNTNLQFNDKVLQAEHNEDRGGPTRTWTLSTVTLIPHTGWFFESKNVSAFLFWLQIVFALTCISLAVFRLAKQNFNTDNALNGSSALNLFYATALAEGLLFLFEKAYWQFMIAGKKLISVVNDELGLEPWGVHTVHRFFYDAFARSVNGNIFAGLKMDFVTFAVDLLMQSNAETQSSLMGASVLSALARNEKNRRLALDTLRIVGTRRDVVEYLIEILSWKNRDKEQIRLSAAEIVLQLVIRERSCVRVAAIDGSLESISSLLYAPPNPPPLPSLPRRRIPAQSGEVRRPQREERQVQRPEEQEDGRNPNQAPSRHPQHYTRPYDHRTFKILGLEILNTLARHQNNCSKIAATGGLLSNIIDGVNVRQGTTVPDTVHLYLRLLIRLASTSGKTGQKLRKDILMTPYAVSNVRDLIVQCLGQWRQQHSSNLGLSIEVLTSLALDPKGRLVVGSTGGVLSSLLQIFLEEKSTYGRETDFLVSKAGEALSLLSLDSKQNCKRMAEMKAGECLNKLVRDLEDAWKGIHAARVLRNICAYTQEDDSYLDILKTAATPALRLIPGKDMGLQEAATGLLARLLGFLTSTELGIVLVEAKTCEQRLMELLLQTLRQQKRPGKIPDMRRFSVELIKCLVEKGTENWLDKWHLKADMIKELEMVMETSSVMENYYSFSGSVVVSEHVEPLHDLICPVISTFA